MVDRRRADAESVEFVKATIGTHFEEFTAHESRESIPGGGSIVTERETRCSSTLSALYNRRPCKAAVWLYKVLEV